MSKSYDPIALEILKMARELVINEYTDRRAQDHNKWLADFEVVWKNNRIRLPYPDIPPYPTETEIVTRAQTLMKFLHQNRMTSEEETPEVKPAEKNNKSHETIVSQYLDAASANNEDILDELAPVIDNESQQVDLHSTDTTAAGILPSIMKKLKM